MHRNTRQSKTKQLLIHRAQLLRANPSWPEQILWNAIRSGQLGFPFRRQVVVDRFIVDLVAPQAKLIVEVDGVQHQLRRSADQRRDRKLARLGYRVLRLEAELVLKQLPLALKRVREVLQEGG
jgi:very-short-patch-repair endonuclease